MNTRYSWIQVSAALVVCATLLTGCATTESGSGSGDLSVVTAEEIEAAGSYSTAYEVVQRLRPQWLRTRGRSNTGFEVSIKLYVDGSRFGASEDLTQINATNIERMEYLRPSQASDRYGMNHDQGAILVELK